MRAGGKLSGRVAASQVVRQTWMLSLLPRTMTGALQVSLVGLGPLVLGCLGFVSQLGRHADTRALSSATHNDSSP